MLWRTLSLFPEVYKNQYKPLKELRKIQEKRLRFIVDFAYRNTRFYKEKFKETGITPSDIQTLTDITRIPVITKNEIKVAYPQKVVASGYSEHNCVKKTTSGTSGNVITLLIDYAAMDHLSAVAFRDHVAQGVRPWHKFFILYHDPAQQKKASKNVLYRMKGVLGILPAEELVEAARVYQPHIMGGHPSTYVSMAKVVEEKGITDVNPRLVLVGGEIAYPSYREYIEKIFCCKTLNKYGAYEAYSIAWECLHHSMHIDADSVIVEFLKDGEPAAPDERGEIVITNLWNKAMPFIRYKMDDIGILSDEVCTCGRGLPLMKELEGRADDFLVLPSGNVIPPTRLIPPFFLTPHIEEFTVIQDTKTHIHIQIVPRKGLTEMEEKTLLQQISAVLGEPLDIDMEKVDSIKRVGWGKFKAVMSRVKMDLA
jgi:phenylacetate-CoA ligase